MFQDKKSLRAITNSRSVGVIQIAFGSFFGFIFGLTFIACFADMFDPNRTTTVGDMFIIFIIFALFLYMLIRGIQRVSFTKTYKYYIQFLGQGQSHSIDELAVVLKAPVHIVRRNLEKMMKKGFIADAYIDDKTNCINSTRYYQAVQPSSVSNSMPNIVKPVQSTKPVEYTEAICKNCGASNKITKGSTADCEYCGSVLN